MQININDNTKIPLAQYPYAILNKLISADEAEKRKYMSEEELIKIFDRVWETELKHATETAASCDVNFVRSKLKDKLQNFVNDSQEHRAFRLQNFNLEFIVQLNYLYDEIYELTQLWFIPSIDIYPQCILICFDDVEERKRFNKLAKKSIMIQMQN